MSGPPSGFAPPLYEPSDPSLDIIAVHGIGAHRDKTWSIDGFNWLSACGMLPNDFPRARIMAYGYGSSWLGRESMATCLDAVAGRLLSHVHELRNDCPERSVIFIAHCFGGIVVEKAILNALICGSDQDRSLVAHISGIVLLGTPHRGSSSAGLANVVASIAAFFDCGQRSPILETVRNDSQMLADTVREFARRAYHLNVRVHCFYEEKETDIGAVIRPFIRPFINVTSKTILVDRDSACLQGHGETALTLDHFKLNKFTNSTDPNYILVRRALREMERKSEEAIVKALGSDCIDAAKIQKSGLTILHDPLEAVLDVILIPGLAGDPWETWSPSSRSRTHTNLGQFWPASFLPKDYPTVRVIVWGFEWERDSTISIGTFLDRASDLLHALTSSRPLGRSMVFVAHSLGGVLLKETLRLAEKGESMATKDIMSYTAAVIFLATPHRGDGDALSFFEVVQRTIARFEKGRAGPEHPSGEIDTRLTACQETFLAQREAYGFHVKCFAENPRPGPFHPDQQSWYIIPKMAATLQGPEVQIATISAGPTGFCRFQTDQDTGYRQLFVELKASIDQIKSRELHLRDDCLKSLYFEQLQNRESDITTALKSTATWLFEHNHYLDWARWDPTQSKQRRGLLWVRGKPGSGKSTLMKEGLRRAKVTGLASSFSVAGFFFTIRRNIRLQKSIVGLFRTLLHDLLQQDKSLLSAFITEYKRKCAANPGPWEWRQNELQDFFKSAYLGEIPRVRKAMVFIDALDESDKDGDNEAYQVARDLVYYFRDITVGDKLKVCLSSRHYPNIKVPDCPQIATEDFNRDDIVQFVTTKLSGVKRDARAKRLAKQIADKADGVFLWVILVVGTLNVKLDNFVTDEDLEETLKAVPSQLEDLFKTLFTNESSKPGLQIAAAIFQWILLAQRPLEKNELRHALTIDREKIDFLEGTAVWHLSGHCLQDGPEEFLTSLRYYTRGLAELTPRWAKGQRERAWSRYYSYPPPDGEGETSRKIPRLSQRPSSNTKTDTDSTEYDLATYPQKSSLSFRRPDLSFLQIQDNDYQPTVLSKHLFPVSDYMLPWQTPRPGFLNSFNSDAGDSDFDDFIISSVQFIHESVREFFLRNQGFLVLESDQHHRSFPERHDILAEYCMACLYQNGPSSRSSLSTLDLMKTYPFLKYAAQSLFYHLREAERGGRVSKHVTQALVAADQRLWKSWVACIPCLPNGKEEFFEDVPGFAPFHFLCRKRMFSSASALLRLGVDVNLHDDRGNSALHHAVSDTATDVIQFLLKNKANPHVQNERCETPLHQAVQCQASDSVMRDMLQVFAVETACLEDTDRHGRTPLHAAVQCGNLVAVQILLTYGAPADSQTITGCTALHLAIEGGRFEIAAELLARGADPNALNQQRKAPIHLAARRPEVSLLQSLIRHRANVNIRDGDGQTPIHLRIKQSLDDRSLIISRAGSKARTVGELSPMQHAIFSQHFPVEHLMVLIDAGADQNAIDRTGKTVLHYVVERSSVLFLERLLQAGQKSMDLSKPDHFGRTPLHYAARRDDLHVFRLLVDAGADIKVGDRDGATPVDYAGDKITRVPYLRQLLESKGYKRSICHIKGRMTAVFVPHKCYDGPTVLGFSRCVRPFGQPPVDWKSTKGSAMISLVADRAPTTLYTGRSVTIRIAERA